MLKKSTELVDALKARLDGVEIYVLADTSYGSCCVDEVAAEHINADLVVHYGDACFTRTSKLPVYYDYTFMKKTHHEASYLGKLICELYSSKDCILIADLECYSLLQDADLPESIYVAKPASSFYAPGSSVDEENTFLGRCLPVAAAEVAESYHVIYVGVHDSLLQAVSITFNAAQISSINPETLEVTRNINTRKLLIKRSCVIEKARSADIIGILVGTMGSGDSFELIQRMRCCIKAAGKTPMVIVVGKLNPAKLANFKEIPVFVTVSCPLMSFIDSKEFYQCIITPFELELVLNEQEWDFRSYETRLDKLLKEMRVSVEIEAEGTSSRELVTTTRDNALVINSPILNVVSDRTWNGLDLMESKKAPALAKEGRKGIARGYHHEICYEK